MRYCPSAAPLSTLVISTSQTASPEATGLTDTDPLAAVHVLEQGPTELPTYATPGFDSRVPVRSDICSPVTETASTFSRYSHAGVSTIFPPACTNGTALLLPPARRYCMNAAWPCC